MDEKILNVAKEAAIEAGKIVKKYYQTELTLQDKGHFTNFATKADVESEQEIIKIIKKNFPEHNIIAEESGKEDKGSNYSWAIDPIDGTIPFVDGIPVFGVSIGVLKSGKPFVGVINMVATDELYWALEGNGAFLNNKKIEVRKEADLKQSTIGLELGHTDRISKLDKLWKPIVEEVRYVYLYGAAVAILSYIARGLVDAYIIGANVWDVAAGIVLIQEAGGRVTGISGNEVNIMEGKPMIICSNALVHDSIVKIYNK